MVLHPQDNNLQNLISTPQTLTGSWVDLGELIDCRDMTAIALWLKVDINNSLDVNIRMISMDDSDAYSLPIKSATTANVSVMPEVIELASDADQNILVDFAILDMLQYVKFQVKVGTVGATAGIITSAKISYNEKEARDE